MTHILRRTTDLMTINRRIEHQTGTISQLTDRIRKLSRMPIIVLNSRIIFLRVLQVARKRMTNRIQMQGTTTIREQINGVVNRTSETIRDRIHRKPVLVPILKPTIQGHRIRIIRKIHIKIRHLTLRSVKNIRKISTKRLVVIVKYIRRLYTIKQS